MKRNHHENGKSVRTLGIGEKNQTCCRVSAEEGRKGEFERGCILLLLRIGLKIGKSSRRGAGGIIFVFRGTFKTKSVAFWNPV